MKAGGINLRKYGLLMGAIVLMSCLNTACTRKEQKMQYTYTKTDKQELQYGTSNVINIIDIPSGEEETIVQGQLITLFGDPLYTTPDLEDAYCYILEVEDRQGNQFVLTVYDGPSGAAIGGDSRVEGVAEAANALKQKIRQAAPSDFEYQGYYLDGPTKIYRKIENGQIYYDETEVDEEELKKVFEEWYGDSPSSGSEGDL